MLRKFVLAITLSGTGQPSQSCQNPATPQNSTKPKSVSQYDVACFEQPSH